MVPDDDLLVLPHEWRYDYHDVDVADAPGWLKPMLSGFPESFHALNDEDRAMALSLLKPAAVALRKMTFGVAA